MPTAQQGRASVDIAAPAELVYDLITDVARMGEWSPECCRCDWLEGASGPEVGARFRGFNRRGLMRWARTAVVTKADRGREFAFVTINDRTGREETQWQYLLESSPRGTLLTESFQFIWCSRGVRAAELLVRGGARSSEESRIRFGGSNASPKRSMRPHGTRLVRSRAVPSRRCRGSRRAIRRW